MGSDPRYVQDVAAVSQNMKDMQRALLDLALMTQADRDRGTGWDPGA